MTQVVMSLYLNPIIFSSPFASYSPTNIRWKISVPESVFNKVVGLELYEKEIPIQEFSCEYCEIFKNDFV